MGTLSLLMLATAAVGCGGASDGSATVESISCPAIVGAWAAGTSYATGALVKYQGTTYRCRQGHTALDNWTPDAVPALWAPVVCSSGGGDGAGGGGGACSATTWQAGTAYHVGDVVLYAANGNDYVATHDNPGYDPTISTWFWSPTTCAGGGGAGGGGRGGGPGRGTG
ncbi:MAG: carbohydrate-binding protein, partial [Polyangia bacterium]